MSATLVHTNPAPLRQKIRKRMGRPLWLIPIALVIALWWALPMAFDIPDYKLPPINTVLGSFWEVLTNGTLPSAILSSLTLLAIAFVIGAGLGLVVGLLMSTNRYVMIYVEPIIAFFQAVAGIAWIPLAIVWFGFGTGPVIFVVANAIFFIVLYNTVLGVESIQPVMYDVLKTLGANRSAMMREVIIPGALVSVLTGLRSGLAFGWRALIAVEFIAANTGIGYLSLEASRNFDGSIVVVTLIVVGFLWLLMDNLILAPIERRTVERWGLVGKTGT